MDTYTDDDGVECCDACQAALDDCACTCEDCGDPLPECACGETAEEGR